MKTELLRMLSPDARDLSHVGGGWASLTPEDICAALAGLPDAPYLLARSVYVADADSYRKLYLEVIGLQGVPKRPGGLVSVRRTCTECGGAKCRLYTDAMRTIPLNLVVQEKVLAKAKKDNPDFELKPDAIIHFFHAIYLTGNCIFCNGQGTVQLRPVEAILDLCMDELFGDNKCGGCGGTGLTHEQQPCPRCKERKFKEQSDLTRSKITGIPFEFWRTYKGFYERLYTQLGDWDVQIRTHLAKRLEA